MGRAVSGAGDVLKPDARLCNAKMNGGPVSLRTALGKEDGLPSIASCVSRGACAGGVDEELVWGSRMPEKLDYSIHHHAHLIVGFGSTKSYAFIY